MGTQLYDDISKQNQVAGIIYIEIFCYIKIPFSSKSTKFSTITIQYLHDFLHFFSYCDLFVLQGSILWQLNVWFLAIRVQRVIVKTMALCTFMIPESFDVQLKLTLMLFLLNNATIYLIKRNQQHTNTNGNFG